MKPYEKPIAELVDFQIPDRIMTEDEDYDDDPNFSEGIEDW